MLDIRTSSAALFDQGRHARYRGDPETANPYPAGSEPHAKWLEGYRYPDGREAERDGETIGIKG
ncbi:MAG: hypothetical protein K2X71_02715 [Methylobacterium sp.]|uniref:hypothetical protein n=1 Tax=Methylobacterium sp. TaxID=409 RepID=UPI002588DA2C|nr:hypothetical protein [Methylobacterium sp.]MBY0294940.1 hypothetical protein [Methylobacterium sp.]